MMLCNRDLRLFVGKTILREGNNLGIVHSTNVGSIRGLVFAHFLKLQPAEIKRVNFGLFAFARRGGNGRIESVQFLPHTFAQTVYFINPFPQTQTCIVHTTRLQAY
jgi:hypothetical protein